MCALVAAHLAHLFLNWYNDSFVMRQRMNCGACRTSQEKHKPPAALPASGLVRWFRLIGALIILLMIFLDAFDSSDREVDHVSHATHLFGALSGFLAGCIFLKVRRFNTFMFYVYCKQILMFVYGFIVTCVIIKFVITRYKIISNSFSEETEYCPWFQYESICQDQCYHAKNHLNKTLNCTVNLCK